MVSLNVDLGELPGEPEELYRIATVVNVACGGHAGDRESMARACALAASTGAAVAAHPSYPDRDGFGRRSLAIAPESLRASIAEQCAMLRDIARTHGICVVAMKPHGALYHDASAKDELARAVIGGAFDALGADAGAEALAIVGPPTSRLREESARTPRTLRYLAEGFADRKYLPSGLLAPRSDPEALILDPARAAQQGLELSRGGTIDTLCIHGDTPGALQIGRAVRAALEREGLLS